MSMYEVIVSIIERKGPTSITALHEELNKLSCTSQEQGKQVQLSHIKSSISKKKELFTLNGEVVSLREEMDFLSLLVDITYYQRPAIKIRVNFITNQFQVFEWYIDGQIPGRRSTFKIGSVSEFRKELYKIKVNEWEKDYQMKHLLLEGTSWSIELVTKAKTYRSEGFEIFPNEWQRLCKALTKLTGMKL